MKPPFPIVDMRPLPEIDEDFASNAAPWEPKVGEWANDKHWGIVRVLALHRFARGTVDVLFKGRAATTRIKHLSPLKNSDWEVEVPGFGKVWAWYDENGAPLIYHSQGVACFRKSDEVELDAACKWCEQNGVPIKPYKEGE